MQTQATQALATAVSNQLSAIQTATYQNIITLAQALALWKRARRDQVGGVGGGGAAAAAAAPEGRGLNSTPWNPEPL